LTLRASGQNIYIKVVKKSLRSITKDGRDKGLIRIVVLWHAMKALGSLELDMDLEL
jgi:hypothetical protein